MGHRETRRAGLAGLVEAALRRRVAGLPPGPRLPAERDLAGQFSVSLVKVREALALLARDGVVERRHGSGTFVADPQSRQWIAVVLIHDLAHPTLSFHSRSVFQSVRRRLASAGLATRGYLGYGNPAVYETLDCREFFEDLAAGRIRHVVPVGGDLAPGLVEDLRRRGIGRTCPVASAAVARRRDLVRLGARYLIEQGRRRLAMLAWVDPCDPGRTSDTGHDEVVSAFKAALAGAGIAWVPEWTQCALHPNLTGAGWQEFRDVWRSCRCRPDGLLICNDLLARDAAVAIAETGTRVPEDLLVVTHDNRGSGQWFPFPVARLQVDPEQDAAVFAHQAMAALGVGEARRAAPPAPACRLIPLDAHGAVGEAAQAATSGPTERSQETPP